MNLITSGLRCNAFPEYQMALITSVCVPSGDQGGRSHVDAVAAAGGEVCAAVGIALCCCSGKEMRKIFRDSLSYRHWLHMSCAASALLPSKRPSLVC